MEETQSRLPKQRSTEVVVRYAERFQFEVLQALARCGGAAKKFELAPMVGRSQVYVYYAFLALARNDLVRNEHNTLHLLERGKIALAIHEGKKLRRRLKARITAG